MTSAESFGPLEGDGWRPDPDHPGYFFDPERPGWFRDREGRWYADPEAAAWYRNEEGRIVFLPAPRELSAAERQLSFPAGRRRERTDPQRIAEIRRRLKAAKRARGAE